MSGSPSLVPISQHTLEIFRLQHFTRFISLLYGHRLSISHPAVWVPFPTLTQVAPINSLIKHNIPQHRDNWTASLRPSLTSHSGPTQDCYEGSWAHAFRPPFLLHLVLTPLRSHSITATTHFLSTASNSLTQHFVNTQTLSPTTTPISITPPRLNNSFRTTCPCIFWTHFVSWDTGGRQMRSYELSKWGLMCLTISIITLTLTLVFFSLYLLVFELCP